MFIRLAVVGIVLMMQTSAGAATEYLRFEGSISSSYLLEFNEQYGLDFVPSQFIYFDFQIDTELDRIGVSDGELVDYFQSTLNGGTLGSGELSFGASGRVVEALISFLEITNGLKLVDIISCEEEVLPEGCANGDALPPFNWQVGDVFTVAPEVFAQDQFGGVTLTYRDAQPPPPIPLPGAVWLMLSALLGAGWFGRPGR